MISDTVITTTGSDSTLTLSLTDGSSYTGCISGNITNSKGSTVSSEVGSVSVSLDSSSTWTLTADTYISSFSGSESNINANGYTLYVNSTALVGGSGEGDDTDDGTTEDETIPVEKIRLNKKKATLTTGNTLNLKVKSITPADATNQEVKWTSSDKSVAKVSSSGKVTAVSAGSCIITCTARDGNGVTASCKVTVIDPVQVTKIKLNKTKATLKVGKTLKLKVKSIAPSDATNKKVKWSSSDKSVAKVSDTGKVTAVGEGSCVITCEATDGSGVQAECKITVKRK